jgi:hypothetical protein
VSITLKGSPSSGGSGKRRNNIRVILGDYKSVFIQYLRSFFKKKKKKEKKSIDRSCLSRYLVDVLLMVRLANLDTTFSFYYLQALNILFYIYFFITLVYQI